MSGEMAQIPDQSPGLIKTGKMFSSVGSEADIFSSSAEETNPEMQRQASKTQLVFGRSNCKSSITVCKSFTNNVWKDITSGVEEENLAVNVKGTVSWERKAVENDDVSSSYAFERNPLDLRLEKEKNASKTLSCELKVENPGGEEEDGCSHEEVNPSSGAESSVQESQGVSKHGCDLLSSAGINNSGASSAPRDNKDDQFLGKDVQKVNHIEDFNLLTVLGEGSFGKVLLCEQRETKQVYAIKALKKDVVLEDDDVECTMVERRVLALATRHPFLTHLHSTFQTQGHLFFVMEYVIGGNLSFLIQRVGKFEEIQARFYAAETVCGLEFLHDRGIIYRDLKLDNVLLDADGHIKLADFGMCKEGIAESKKASTFCGTDDYIAPEILQRRQYDAAADWWSFGVLLYKMLTGQFPFAGEGREELFYSICRDEVHYPEEISSNAEDCLCQLFQRTPVERLAYKKGRKPNIRGHKFFDRLDWTKLEQRKVQPPFKPEVTSDRDTSNFDPDFTTEVPQFTPTDKDLLQSMDQGQFKGFSFVNPYSGSQQ